MKENLQTLGGKGGSPGEHSEKGRAEEKSQHNLGEEEKLLPVGGETWGNTKRKE